MSVRRITPTPFVIGTVTGLKVTPAGTGKKWKSLAVPLEAERDGRPRQLRPVPPYRKRLPGSPKSRWWLEGNGRLGCGAEVNQIRDQFVRDG